MNKELNDYTLTELREMENFGEDSLFTDVVIVPMNELHDSGYRCMKFILVYFGEIVGCVSGWSDVILLTRELSEGIRTTIDCLRKSKCVRLMLHCKCKCDDFVGSDFIIHKVAEL